MASLTVDGCTVHTKGEDEPAVITRRGRSAPTCYDTALFCNFFSQTPTNSCYGRRTSADLEVKHAIFGGTFWRILPSNMLTSGETLAGSFPGPATSPGSFGFVSPSTHKNARRHSSKSYAAGCIGRMGRRCFVRDPTAPRVTYDGAPSPIFDTPNSPRSAALTRCPSADAHPSHRTPSRSTSTACCPRCCPRTPGPDATADELLAHAEKLSAQMALRSYHTPFTRGMQDFLKNEASYGGRTGQGHADDRYRFRRGLWRWQRRGRAWRRRLHRPSAAAGQREEEEGASEPGGVASMGPLRRMGIRAPRTSRRTGPSRAGYTSAAGCAAGRSGREGRRCRRRWSGSSIKRSSGIAKGSWRRCSVRCLTVIPSLSIRLFQPITHS